MGFSFSRSRPHRLETREQMIAETSAFLSAALRDRREVPRIPARRVDVGGVSVLLRARPAFRAAVTRWWSRVLTLESLD